MDSNQYVALKEAGKIGSVHVDPEKADGIVCVERTVYNEDGTTRTICTDYEIEKLERTLELTLRDADNLRTLIADLKAVKK